ncbi:acyl-CoA thioester hydrolase/BAAT C-terminal domain-containing protein [Halorussus lipolyticus]|uniref:acyl-CoA thioester hydrolase/BAAT C-terminal domain-containing protein n=1 Tax=Halorussus lipolyticus TaxID=3034024 RepID=UPI0023E756A3|nr:acyl-CoA thioester hydrolase/BAAT C-terminal domain-containing protein [Halorussus sp. DT80]
MSADLVPTRDVRRDDLTGTLFAGLGSGPHPGLLVVHGSGGGGGYERHYARRLAHHGYAAFCVEYFDGPGRPDGLDRIPLEYFGRAIDWLVDQPEVDGERVGAVGFSRGGEAVMLTGAHFDRVGAIVAYSASGYTFPAPTWMPGVEEEGPAWTLDGEVIPYLPVDELVTAEQDGFEDVVENDDVDASTLAVENATDEQLREAAIPVERIDGPVLLVSGGDDAIWPSADLAGVADDRLADHSWPAEHLVFPDAGHAIRTPYRPDGRTNPDATHRLGGTHGANARAAADAWQATLDYLGRGLGGHSSPDSSPGARR